MTIRAVVVLSASAAAIIAGLGGVAASQSRQVVTPPKARYAMDVETLSGITAMGQGGGMRAALSMMSGGPQDAHFMHLRLGSTLPPTGGEAKADHFVPAGLRMGQSLPLHYQAGKEGEGTQEFQRPKMRLLLFWGCGERAPAGQPVVIDFAKLNPNTMPPNLFSTTVPVDKGPRASNSRTYGEWPNIKDRQAAPPARGSLLGAHRIAGNYSPEINFSLTQDWMQGIRARNQVMPSGAVGLSWGSVPTATGYYAWAIGMKGGTGDGRGQPTDAVWWTSSNSREFGAGLWDWLPPETVQRLVGQKVVMPPSQTSCTIPAEVKAASPEFLMGSIAAFGPEANFVYPPRPANPREPWNQEWTARVRYRSTTAMLVGMPGMDEMMSGSDEAPATEEEEAPKPRKKCKSLRGILGGIVSGEGC